MHSTSFCGLHLPQGFWPSHYRGRKVSRAQVSDTSSRMKEEGRRAAQKLGEEEDALGEKKRHTHLGALLATLGAGIGRYYARPSPPFRQCRRVLSGVRRAQEGTARRRWDWHGSEVRLLPPRRSCVGGRCVFVHGLHAS